MAHTTLRSRLLLAVLAASLLPGCVAATKYRTLEDELARLQGELSYSQQQLMDAETLLADAQFDESELASAQARADQAERDRASLESRLNELSGKTALLSERGIEVVFDRESGMAGFRGGSDVFFNSGSDVLSQDGKGSLDLIAGELSKFDGPIRVDGHTDTDPVSKTKDKFPKGNIQLGASRAIAVREYLIERGIPENRIWIASHGPFKPLTQSDSKEAKAKNRRVEILVPVAAPQGKGTH